MIGRPAKIDDKLIKRISGYIARGNYIKTACKACGISDETYQAWKRRAKAALESKEGPQPDDEIYIKFFNAITDAEVQAETVRIGRIEEAGIGGKLIKVVERTLRDGTVTREEYYSKPEWQADMTVLERRHPDRWGRRQELTGKGGGPILFKVVYDKDDDNAGRD